MDDTITHLKVPTAQEQRAICLGPDGSFAHVSRVLRMIQGRWKLSILFRLYADLTWPTSQLRRDLTGVSQKMLTQHLRELERDGLIDRIDPAEKPRRIDYRLPEAGRRLLPVQVAARAFSINHRKETAGEPPSRNQAEGRRQWLRAEQ